MHINTNRAPFVICKRDCSICGKLLDNNRTRCISVTGSSLSEFGLSIILCDL